MRGEIALSSPLGDRGRPTRSIPISSSRQNRAISYAADPSLVRRIVRRAVAKPAEASAVASPIRFSPKSIARIRVTRERVTDRAIRAP